MRFVGGKIDRGAQSLLSFSVEVKILKRSLT